jgi:hypothetical protein
MRVKVRMILQALGYASVYALVFAAVFVHAATASDAVTASSAATASAAVTAFNAVTVPAVEAVPAVASLLYKLYGYIRYEVLLQAFRLAGAPLYILA